MNISPHIPLIIGIIAGTLFVIVFVVAAIITALNRRTIRRFKCSK